jgi:hypothetical protein
LAVRRAGVASEEDESASSTSFGLFDESVSDERFIPGNPFPIYDYRVDASQTSTIDENGVTAVGQAHSDGMLTASMCAPCWPGCGSSNLEWTFDVTSPTHFALSGTLETEVADELGWGTIFDGEVTARVRLGGPARIRFLSPSELER